MKLPSLFQCLSISFSLSLHYQLPSPCTQSVPLDDIRLRRACGRKKVWLPTFTPSGKDAAE